MPPLVSILIPSYNAEGWISATIKSALAQTWPNKEVIVIDDGSSDGTLRVAQQFKDIQVVTQRNQGAAVARNHAYSLSRGSYLQWLDADDLLDADKINAQMKEAERAGSARVLLSSGWGTFSYRISRAKFIPTLLWCDLAPLEWMLRKWEGNLFMQTGTWLVSRVLSEAAGPWDTRLTMDDDGEYFSRVVRASERIRFVPEAKVYYRAMNFGRLSHVGRDVKKMESQLLSMKLQIQYLLSLAEDARVRAACLTYLRTWLPTFYPDRPDLVLEVQKMAVTFNGRLAIPVLGWKYKWIERLFGPSAGKRAQLEYNRLKSSVLRAWDRILYGLETDTGRSNSNIDRFVP